MQNLSNQQAELPPEQRRPLPPVSIIEQQVLDQLIVREIQLQRADRVGMTVSDDLLNEALSRVASNLGYTLEELPAVLAAQGLDYTAYREDRPARICSSSSSSSATSSPASPLLRESSSSAWSTRTRTRPPGSTTTSHIS